MNRKKPTKAGDMPGQPSRHIEKDQWPMDGILILDELSGLSIITLIDSYSRVIIDCSLSATDKPGPSNAPDIDSDK